MTRLLPAPPLYASIRVVSVATHASSVLYLGGYLLLSPSVYSDGRAGKLPEQTAKYDIKFVFVLTDMCLSTTMEPLSLTSLSFFISFIFQLIIFLFPFSGLIILQILKATGVVFFNFRSSLTIHLLHSFG